MIPIQIITAENGWIVVYSDGKTSQQSCFEYDESNFDGITQVKAYQRMLYRLTELLGMLGTKHDKERIKIDIEKGE